MTTLTITSRAIAEMLARGDRKLLRAKMARLTAWHKANLFEIHDCEAVNSGIGRGGALAFPPKAKSYATLFDELVDDGASLYEIVLLTSGFPIQEMETGLIGRAMRGEESVWLFWQRPAEGDTSQIPLHRKFVFSPTLPDGWTSGKWINLTAVFARARQ